MSNQASVIVINLWEPTIECWACGLPDLHKWGLPIDECAELVPNDYEGEWGSVPACRECYQAHAEGLLTAATLTWWRRRQQLKSRAMCAAFARE